MRRSIRILAAAAVAAAILVPAGAQADHTCTGSVVIFSGMDVEGQRVGFVNSNAGICTVGSDAEDVYDGRIINPGSNAITVRYLEDHGEGVPAVIVQLDGLGYDGETFEAPRNQSTTGAIIGSYTYDTALIPIDPTASGTITATIFVAGFDEPIDSTTFRTIDS